MNTVFFGPFIGSLSTELINWTGICRFRAQTTFKDTSIIAASFPGRQPLYRDFVREFVPLPTWFSPKKIDRYEPETISSEEYSELLQYFKQFCPKGTIEIRPPRNWSISISHFHRQKFIKFHSSNEAQQRRDHLLSTEYIVLSGGNKRYLNHRNYLHWIDIIDLISTTYPNFKIVLTGHPSDPLGTLSRPNVLNLISTPIEDNLDLTISLLENALCSISSQSGFSILSLLTLCPSVIIGHECDKYIKDYNYLKSPAIFINNQTYDASPAVVFEHIQTFVEEIKKRRKS